MPTYDAARPTGFPCWFDLMSPDVKGAAAFYKDVFGWHYEASSTDFNHYHMAYTHGRSAAGIGQDCKTPTAWTVYYAAEDIETMTAQAQQLGGQVVSGPFAVPGKGHMAIISDPTGAVFGLWQAGNHKGAEITDVHGGMTWCEVNTPDADRAKAFYSELFDATTHPLEDSPSPYYLLNKGYTTVGGILHMDEHWAGVSPHWMAYFKVDDSDAAAKRAEAAGGKVCIATFDTSYGRLAVLDDPFGTTFSGIQSS